MRTLRLKVFSFLEYHLNRDDVDADPEKVMSKFEARLQNDDMVRQLFDLDIAYIKKANVLILLLPAGISAHMEAGCAYGLGKRCILIGKPKKTETVYCMFSERYNNIDEFINSISGET